MPNESIVFDPVIEDRQLDREVDKVDSRLEDTGHITPELGDLEGDMDLGGVGGGLGGGGRGGGRGGGGMGMGRAGGAGAIAGLSSKIPKPIAGVSVGAALPVALGGAIGVGMLSAMHSASAALQTDAKMMGIAVDNFFREPGNILAKHVTGPITDSFFGFSVDFDEALRSDKFVKATGMLLEAGVELSRKMNPLNWPGLAGEWLINEAAKGFGRIKWGAVIPDFPGFPDIPKLWPGFPDIMGQWPGFPNIMDQWPGFPNVKQEWNNLGWPEISPPDWSSLDPEMPDWSGLELDLPSWLDRWVDGEADRPSEDSGGGSGNVAPHFRGPPDLGFQRGGVINRPTPVMAGEAGTEVITPIAELRRMMENVAQQASGGGGDGRARQVDTSEMETKLDRVNRNLSQLARAMQDLSIEVDGETLGRVSSKAQMDQVTDTDPLVR